MAFDNKRRNFLKLCVGSLPSLALATRTSGANIATASMGTVYRTPGTLDRYIDPLPILKRLSPENKKQNVAYFRMRMLEFSQQLHSQLPPTRLWGYEGQYPGPTVEALHGEPIEMLWENHLPSRHILEIDPHIHGAMPPAPAVRTVPHLHGAQTASESDGLPENWFTPEESARYSYPNRQRAATLWYHDHALGITRLNVYAGLSGFFLLRDEDEHRMDLPSGEFEIPLLLQDRNLDDKGQLLYCPTNEDGRPLAPGVWGPEFFGNLPVVNGAIYPYLEVEPRRYRFRVLNGANSRFFNLYLNLAIRPTDVPFLVAFHQIGTDGGFLPSQVELKKLLLGPAERADLIVDFSGLEGKTVTLSNDAAAPYPGWGMLYPNRVPLYELMQFRVTLPKSSSQTTGGAAAPPFTKLMEAEAALTRDFVLTEKIDGQGRSLGVRINAKSYDDPVTENVKLNSKEIWRFINTTDDAHPMHLHLVQFQILRRQGFNAASFRSGTLELAGAPRPPQANEAGWKDTAVVHPGEVLSIIIPFEGYAGRYVFHCHMLEHEDNDMMRPYIVLSIPSKTIA
jgi:spore coat protein A